jgi:hypothetical protein
MGRVGAVLSFQGEADALAPARHAHRVLSAATYGARFATVVQDIKSDLGMPALPLVFAQIGTRTAPEDFSEWAIIQEQPRGLTLPGAAMITTDDFPRAHAVHYTTDSYRIIGRRFAGSYLGLLDQPEWQVADWR